MLLGYLDYLDIRSILDVGSGTGRAVAYLKQRRPDIRVVGVEPVAELREIGHQSGLSADELRDGTALDLDFGAGEFDVVCEFGMLHHVRDPDRVVDEMLRVADRAVFIFDCNNFGQGSFLARSVKQAINALGLWKLADRIKTRGKGYSFTEGDGVSYSYSVFNNYRQLEKVCKKIHLLNTIDGRFNLYRTASHLAILGIT